MAINLEDIDLFSPEFRVALLGSNPPIEAAHNSLLKKGYQFIGYHGSSQASLKSIVPFGFNPVFTNSGGGNVKGRGFYISRGAALALDWADSITQISVSQKYPGDRGEEAILRIYVKNLESMTLGKHLTWGIQSSDGDLNGDRNVYSTRGLEHDLELVFRPSVYKNLAAIPSGGIEFDNQLIGRQISWPPHEHIEDYNPFDEVLGKPPALSRHRSR